MTYPLRLMLCKPRAAVRSEATPMPRAAWSGRFCWEERKGYLVVHALAVAFRTSRFPSLPQSSCMTLGKSSSFPASGFPSEGWGIAFLWHSAVRLRRVGSYHRDEVPK